MGLIGPGRAAAAGRGRGPRGEPIEDPFGTRDPNKAQDRPPMGPPNLTFDPNAPPPGTPPGRGITGGVPDGTGGVGPGMPGGPPAAQNPAARSPFAERFGTGPGGIDPNARPGPTTSIPPQAAVPPAPLTPPGQPTPPAPLPPLLDFPIPGRTAPAPRGQSFVGRSPGRSTQEQRTDDPFDLPIFDRVGPTGIPSQTPGGFTGRGPGPGVGFPGPPGTQPGPVPSGPPQGPEQTFADPSPFDPGTYAPGRPGNPFEPSLFDPNTYAPTAPPPAPVASPPAPTAPPPAPPAPVALPPGVPSRPGARGTVAARGTSRPSSALVNQQQRDAIVQAILAGQRRDYGYPYY